MPILAVLRVGAEGWWGLSFCTALQSSVLLARPSFFSSQQAEFSMFLLPCAPQLHKTRDPIISALQAQLSGVRQVQAFFALRKGRQQAKVLNRNLSFFSLLHRKLEKSSK